MKKIILHLLQESTELILDLADSVLEGKADDKCAGYDVYWTPNGLLARKDHAIFFHYSKLPFYLSWERKQVGILPISGREILSWELSFYDVLHALAARSIMEPEEIPKIAKIKTLLEEPIDTAVRLLEAQKIQWLTY